MGGFLFFLSKNGILISMKSFSITITLIALVCIGLFFVQRFYNTTHTITEDVSISAIEYVKSNISTLSPEKEVLGGVFYVTQISAKDGKGFVEYEDGHIALKATFTYEKVNNEIQITSFTIQPD